MAVEVAASDLEEPVVAGVVVVLEVGQEGRVVRVGPAQNGRRVSAVGIDELDPTDLRYAGELGYRVKLIAVAQLADGEPALELGEAGQLGQGHRVAGARLGGGPGVVDDIVGRELHDEAIRDVTEEAGSVEVAGGIGIQPFEGRGDRRDTRGRENECDDGQ